MLYRRLEYHRIRAYYGYSKSKLGVCEEGKNREEQGRTGKNMVKKKGKGNKISHIPEPSIPEPSIPETSRAERWLDPDTFIYKGKAYRISADWKVYRVRVMKPKARG